MKGHIRLVIIIAALVVLGVAVTDTGAQSASPAAPGTAGAPSATPRTSATATPAAPGQLPAGAAPSDYVIGPEDVLQISVWKNETLSRIVPVRPDGKISMPLLHDVQAAGLTAMQLRDKLSAALSEFMPNPEVSVIINEVRSFRVSVLGEVQKPGVLQLKSSTTVLEALAMAGGLRDFASPGKIVIFRRDESGNTKKIRFNYNKAVGSSGFSLDSIMGDRNASEDQNLILKSGDVIVVP